jgi:undecaprenyl diphosphate synthase
MKPKHIAVIPDGNRRYARERNLEDYEGHFKGAEKVNELIEWALDLQVPQISVFGFSEQNFLRSEHEKKYLFELFEREAEKLISRKEELKEKGIKITYFGRIYKLPDSLVRKLNEVEVITGKNENLRINIALAYGGVEEITDAVNFFSFYNIKDDALQRRLSVVDDVDILIRTGKERRLSNFLLIQSRYAEIFFLDKYWPELEKEDLEKIIREFEATERRFGK